MAQVALVSAWRRALLVVVLVASGTASEADQVEVRGTPGDETVAAGSPVRLWLAITNSTAAINDLRIVELFPPTMTVERASWSCDATALPAAGASSPMACPIATSVSHSTQLSAWIEVTPPASRRFWRAERVRPVVTVAWTSVPPGQESPVPSSATIVFPEISVRGGFSMALVAAREFIRDLGIPLLLLLLGIVGQRYLMRLTREGETWNLMLPESHKNVMACYLSIQDWSAAAVRGLTDLRSRMLQREEHGPASARHRNALFELIMVEGALRRLHDHGGLYLKHRAGERLIARCIERYRHFALSRWAERTGTIPNGRELMSTLISRVEPSTHRGVFWRRMTDRFADGYHRDAADALVPLEAAFTAWLPSDDAAQALEWLDLLWRLLHHEINRPYDLWYGERQWLNLPASLEKRLVSDPDVGAAACVYIEDEQEPKMRAELRQAREQSARLSRM